MLFKTTNNEISHYLPGSPANVMSEVYIFSNMTKNSNAYVELIKLNALSIGSSEFPAAPDQRYRVHLDLLGNQRTQFLTYKINLLTAAVTSLGYRFSTGNALQDFTIPNLTIAQVCALIDSPQFQSANVLDTFSTWRVNLDL